MVNMIGFHHREPEYNTALPGELGYYESIQHMPSAGFPWRAKVTTPTGHGIFYDANDAGAFLDTPHKEMAKRYIEWYMEKTAPGTKM